MSTSAEHLKRTTTGTFRIPEEHYYALQTRATENRTSLNALLNQIIDDYLMEDKPRVGETTMILSRDLFAVLLSKISKEDAVRLGREVAAKHAESAILARHGEVSVNSVVNQARQWSVRGGWGEYSETIEGGMRIVGTQHQLGPNGSALLAATWGALFQAAGISPKILVKDDIVIAEVPVERKSNS